MNPLALHLRRQADRHHRTALMVRILQAMAPHGERPMLLCFSKNTDGKQGLRPLSLDNRQSLSEYIDQNGAFGVALGINGQFVMVHVDDKDLGVQAAPIPNAHYLVCDQFADFKDWFDGLLQVIGSQRRSIRPDLRSRPPFHRKR